MKLFCDPPRLDWRETGPVAPDFNDIYFSVEGGLEETRAVFLAGCGLPEAWQHQERFVIGELGFGTGLNFLATWQMWAQTRPAAGWLHFISVEKFPLLRRDMERALSAFPELAEFSAQLLSQWPQAIKGPHHLRFDKARITLTLFQDDISCALPQMEAGVDAWFLDGFAPANNDAMWAEDIWSQLARLSNPGARVATFTVAGAVRRGLHSAGFAVEKKPGFGRKRERLEAVFQGVAHTAAPSPFQRTSPHKGAIIIRGGGIAGASLAHALKRRGREVAILDPEGLAAGASGAPSGLLTPRLENADRPHVRATLCAFEFARQLYSDLGVFEPEGAMRLLGGEADRRRYGAIAEAMGEGYDLGPDGFWMQRAGRFSPVDVVHALAGDVRAISNPDQSPEASLIIDCRGPKAALSDMNASAGRVIVADGPALPHPVVWGGYASSTKEGRILIGATHEKGAEPGAPQVDEAYLLADLADHLPDQARYLSGPYNHWTGVRATTPDRLPVMGRLPDQGFEETWRSHARGGPLPKTVPEDADPQNLILSGFGSRGFAHAPLLAEALAADLCGEPSPLEKAGRDAFHPARFVFRHLKRATA